jgi:hypothetical protein
VARVSVAASPNLPYAEILSKQEFSVGISKTKDLLMGGVILGPSSSYLLFSLFMRRGRTRLSRKEQYLSPSALRLLRAHIPILLIGATLAAVITQLAT